MRNIILFFALCAGLGAQEVTLLERPAGPPKLWRGSITALAAANLLDVHSSWGKRELNSTLAGSNGNFGKEGALMKLGLQGGLIGLEYLITRGHPSHKLYRVLTVVNFTAAGAIGGVAAHNYTVPRPR